ncbi:MAG: type II toxin-antitoxin system RatA family toxin [Pseudomonadota bacterium]
MEKINRSALLPYTPQEMFVLVSDIESYPDFLPWCTGTRVLSREYDEVRARIDFSVSGMTRSFTTRNRHQVNKMIEIQLVEGLFSRLTGCWQFEPLGEEGCKISLFLEYDFSSRMLGMVIGPVFSQIANTLVDSFQKRAIEVYGPR